MGLNNLSYLDKRWVHYMIEHAPLNTPKVISNKLHLSERKQKDYAQNFTNYHMQETLHFKKHIHVYLLRQYLY